MLSAKSRVRCYNFIWKTQLGFLLFVTELISDNQIVIMRKLQVTKLLEFLSKIVITVYNVENTSMKLCGDVLDM